MQTLFQFRSTHFNITNPREYFLNPSCFGDDLGAWLGEKLRERGHTASLPEQEDFGWYIEVSMFGKSYRVVVGFQPNDIPRGDCWFGQIEHRVGFLGFLLGRQDQAIGSNVVEVFDSILRSAPEVEGLEWKDGMDISIGDERSDPFEMTINKNKGR